MNETPIIIAGLISVAAVVVAAVIIFGRLKIEQQRTIQKLLEKDDESRPELAQALGSLRRHLVTGEMCGACATGTVCCGSLTRSNAGWAGPGASLPSSMRTSFRTL